MPMEEDVRKCMEQKWNGMEWNSVANRKMVAVTVPVCQYYKYGYYRYQEMCRFERVHELCDNTECVVILCRKLHPKTYRYFKEF